MADVTTPANNNNNNNAEDPLPNPPPPPTAPPNEEVNNFVPREGLFTVQDRLLQTIFFRISLAYARGCPKSLRRCIETLILLKAILCFFMLIYIHINFGRNHVSCLEEYKDSWPREGILRVEIMRAPPETYSLAESYERERRLQLKHRQSDELSALFRFLDSYLYGGGDSSPFSESRPSKKPSENIDVPSGEDNSSSLANATTSTDVKEEIVGGMIPSEAAESNTLEEEIAELEYANSELIWPLDEYIFEYSSEHGFLRLPPATREKLNITVKLVVLDPQRNSCFGESFSQLILQNFLGYDDVLISSIKSLAEHEDNKGYLRNVVSSAHYHFVSRWTSSSSYFLAFLVMMAFTVSISTLSRYSQHQIFVFIMELLQRLEFNTAVTFQAAPLLTEILAFVGMEAIMSEFFEDTTTAFYIILIVWVADQYDAICCRTAITKMYWLRFFYLYHFSFYAYHYRFNGQYSGLALLTMWLFTQHSMIYFFHHYELPAILQQVQFQNIVIRAERLQPNNEGANNNNNNDVLMNNNNLPGPPLATTVTRRLRNLNFGVFRFGVIFQTHRGGIQQMPIAGNPDIQQQQQPNRSTDEATDVSTPPPSTAATTTASSSYLGRNSSDEDEAHSAVTELVDLDEEVVAASGGMAAPEASRETVKCDNLPTEE